MKPLLREILDLLLMIAGTATVLMGFYKLVEKVIESNEVIKLNKTIGANTVKLLQVSHELSLKKIQELEDDLKKIKFELEHGRQENERFREKALDTLQQAYKLVMDK